MAIIEKARHGVGHQQHTDDLLSDPQGGSGDRSHRLLIVRQDEPAVVLSRIDHDRGLPMLKDPACQAVRHNLRRHCGHDGQGLALPADDLPHCRLRFTQQKKAAHARLQRFPRADDDLVQDLIGIEGSVELLADVIEQCQVVALCLEGLVGKA